jgi:predicted nucleic acid-binding protein
LVRTGVATSGRFTLDTNILVYSVDTLEPVRHPLAIEIIRRAAYADCILTYQALSEFYWVSTRKSLVRIERAAELVNRWLSVFPCAAVSATAVRSALSLAAAGRASYWDALLVATAAEAGCSLVLTEDLADGGMLGGVAIHNPFAAAGRMTEEARQLLDL